MSLGVKRREKKSNMHFINVINKLLEPLHIMCKDSTDDSVNPRGRQVSN